MTNAYVEALMNRKLQIRIDNRTRNALIELKNALQQYDVAIENSIISEVMCGYPSYFVMHSNDNSIGWNGSFQSNFGSDIITQSDFLSALQAGCEEYHDVDLTDLM